MSPSNVEVRLGAAGKLLAHRHRIAVEVMERLFAEGWGEFRSARARNREMCLRDQRYHLEFLAGAVTTGSGEQFADYVAWVTRVLTARGICLDGLDRCLHLLGQSLRVHLSDAEMRVTETVYREGLSGLVERAPTPPSPRRDPDPESPGSRFLEAILDGDRGLALHVAGSTLRGGAARLEPLVRNALHDVGRLWERNEIPVAREHLATGTVQYLLARLQVERRLREAPRGRAVVTGVQDEQHQIGPLLVADALEDAGWEVRFLGSDLPHGSVLQVVAEHRAHLVCVSATMAARLPQVVGLIRAVRERFGADLRVLLGGTAFAIAPTLAMELGADAYAVDAAGAVRLAEDWFGNA